MAERELLTIGQACVRANVGRTTIYSWLKTGRIEVVRTPGGSIRIYADTLVASSASEGLAAQLNHAITVLQLQQELIEALQKDIMILRQERDDARAVQALLTEIRAWLSASALSCLSV